MDAEEFLAALAPAVTDADARERFLADPRAVLAAAGLELPEWFAVTAREGESAALTITLPGPLDPHTDLTEENLEGAGGGFIPCDQVPPSNLHQALYHSTGIRWPHQ